MAVLTNPATTTVSAYGGRGSVHNTGNPILDDAGSPVARDIRLYDSFSGLLLRKTVSGADGIYSITDLQVGLVVDVVFLDDAAGTVHEHIIKSRVVVA